ncbi:Ser-Thr-rich GPI-anchored membrane family protein [Streptomyces sp. NPDC089919]|uniref:Ser-Thr-rich GPI-anchored membrane family protein n=1 Tax=Streptomyces sp. NPDC089919 TaxID=3155188 RepID=UPI0034181048
MSTPSVKSAWTKARRAASHVNSLYSRPAAAVLLGTDDLVVEAPHEGAVWEEGTEQVVRWYPTGPLDALDIRLVQREGTATVTRAVLATGVPAHHTTARVTVPAGTATGECRLLITGPGMLDAYSGPFLLVAA